MQNKSKSPFKIALSRFIHNKIAMLWIIFLLIITIVSIIAPLIAPFPVNQQDLLNIKGEMTAQNILGTDSGGRDNFSRLLYAGRISLSIGITSTIGMLLIGITVGVISGYFGGIVDTLLMRITQFVMLFPFLIFAIVLNAALGDKIKNPYGSAIILVLVIIVLSWEALQDLFVAKYFKKKKMNTFWQQNQLVHPHIKLF